jgi:diaminobutyrate acetyltransferase
MLAASRFDANMVPTAASIVTLSYCMPPTNTGTTPHAAADAANSGSPDGLEFRCPGVADGVRVWEIARDSQVLDLNSSYAYVLWCRDFAATSVVAVDTGRVVGFVSGYVRPQRADTLFIWQVAVDAGERGRGMAGRMLDRLLDRLRPDGVMRLETTISPDNTASQALFTALARRRHTDITKHDLFAPEHFPDSHQAEELYLIGHDDGGPQ